MIKELSNALLWELGNALNLELSNALDWELSNVLDWEFIIENLWEPGDEADDDQGVNFLLLEDLVQFRRMESVKSILY